MASRKIWNNSPSELTEFGALSSDIRPTGGIFARLWKRKIDGSDNSESSSAAGSQTSSRETSVERDEAVSKWQPKDERDHSVRSQSSPETEDDSSISEETDATNLHSVIEESVPTQRRNLISVLSRLRNILDRGSSKESDFKQYWMPDSSCHECYDCGDKFTTFRRRHHCRICGQIFCSKCCNQELPGKIIGYKGGVRVCAYCCRVVTSYAQQSEASEDLSFSREDLKNLSSIESFVTGNLDAVWWTLVMRKRYSSSILEEQGHCRSLSSPDITSVVPQKNAPFDITPQSEFSCVENITYERKILTQDSMQLRELWRQIQDPTFGIEMQSHRFRLKTYHKCITGKEFVDWLLKRDKAAKRVQAVAIGQALIDAAFLEPIGRQLTVFQDDYTLYRSGEAANILERHYSVSSDIVPNADDTKEPSWLQEIKVNKEDEDDSITMNCKSSASILVLQSEEHKSDTDVKMSVHGSSTFYRKPNQVDPGHACEGKRRSGFREVSEFEPMPGQDSSISDISDDFLTGTLLINRSGSVVEPFASPQGWRSAEQLKNENGEFLAFDRLNKVHKEHLRTLVCPLLGQEGLSLTWETTILSKAHHISRLVSPNVRNEGDYMDIRQYVQIKKIPGGQHSDTSVIHGVVCTKNVAHKKMQQQVSNPTILLLKGAIEYQRVENKFSSLEPQILQEREFLKNSVARVSALKPHVVMVEKSVSRLAQQFLLEAGISLVFGVKPSVMERIARCTKADVVHSIDGLVSKPTLGCCKLFQVKNYQLPNGNTKTLLFFDGCDPHLGCTVSLRGGSVEELKRVKKIMKFLIYAAYHSQLEISFIMDEFGMPPPTSEETGLQLDSLEDSLIKGKQTEKTSNVVFKQNASEADNLLLETQTKISGKEQDSLDNEPTIADGPGAVSGCLQGTLKGAENAKLNFDVKCAKETNKRKSSEMEELTDFSDPLHNYQKNQDESIFHSTIALQEQKMARQQKFRKALAGLVLSVSPYMKLDPPFLETNNGAKCSLRKYLPDEMYWSPHLSEKKSSMDLRSKYFDNDAVSKGSSKRKLEITEVHPLIMNKLTLPVVHNSIQGLLANFRARGGRIKVVRSDKTGDSPAKEVTKSSSVELKETLQSCYWERKRDCLDINNLQRLSVLFSSFSYRSANAPNPCVNPWVVTMEFYGKNDVTLGGFLERFCFRESYVCPSDNCDTSMLEHVRRFVHDNGCISVLLRKLENRIPGAENNILMWSWCKKCKQVTPVVRMTMDTWCMSFAKYLELRFCCTKYKRRASAEPCNHLLHQEHFQYFGHKDIVASFKYSSIILREVVLPSISVSLQKHHGCPEELLLETRVLTFMSMDVYNTILEQTVQLQKENQLEKQSLLLAEYRNLQQNEMARLREHAQAIQQKVCQLEIRDAESDQESLVLKEAQWNTLWNEIVDSISELKKMIAESVVNWNTKIQEFVSQQKKLEKSKSQSSPARKDASREKDVSSSNDAASETSASSIHSNVTLDGANLSPKSSSPCRIPQVIENSYDDSVFSVDSFPKEYAISNSQASSVHSQDIQDTMNLADEDKSMDTPLGTSMDTYSVTPGIMAGIWPDSFTSYDQTTDPSYSYLVEEIEKSTDSLSETEVLTRSPIMGDNCQEASTSAKLLEEKEPKPKGRVDVKKEIWRSYSDETVQQEKRSAYKTLLSSFLPTSGCAAIGMPFEPHIHPLLPPCEQVPIVVYDTELSSIIAYALSSCDYHIRLQEIQAQMGLPQKELHNSSPVHQRKNLRSMETSSNNSVRTTETLMNIMTLDSGRKHGGVLAFLRGSTSARDRSPKLSRKFDFIDIVRYNPKLDVDSMDTCPDETDGFSLISSNELEKTKAGKQSINSHIELQFSDNTTKFYCRIHFAEQFRKLRTCIFPAGEDVFIRSLNRSRHWAAKGGKSCSSFSKTCDNRFILKQMSGMEADSFQAFAPNYFQYLTTAYQKQKPTVLAKILGVYTIGFRNTQTGIAMKQDLLVMENLFYDRKISQTFDLKGSVRNRMANTSGKQEEEMVLLDQNLLKLNVESPLYTRPHSKAILTTAITSDSQFLASNLVMDYSLLVGQDDQRKELVIGIIDYIRTFTWDKKLEMAVKASGILGGQGKMPTVVSPELYKSRFLEAMDRYFSKVPDRWSGLGHGLDY